MSGEYLWDHQYQFPELTKKRGQAILFRFKLGMLLMIYESPNVKSHFLQKNFFVYSIS